MTTENKMKTFSMALDIDSFMRNNRYPKGWDIFLTDDGSEMSPAAAYTYLTVEKAKGHKLIPCNRECSNPCKHSDNGCTGFDYKDGGCPGRYTESVKA